MLKYLIEAEGHLDLLGALEKTTNEQLDVFRRLIRKIHTEHLIDEKTALTICTAYWEGIGGDIVAWQQILAQVQKQRPKPQNQPDNEHITDQTSIPSQLGDINNNPSTGKNVNTSSKKLKRSIVKWIGITAASIIVLIALWGITGRAKPQSVSSNSDISELNTEDNETISDFQSKVNQDHAGDGTNNSIEDASVQGSNVEQLEGIKLRYSEFIEDNVLYSDEWGGYYYLNGDAVYKDRNPDEWYFEGDIQDMLVADINGDSIPELFLGALDEMGIYTLQGDEVEYLGIFAKADVSNEECITIYIDKTTNNTLAVSEGLSGTGAGNFYSIDYNIPGTLELVSGPGYVEDMGSTYYYADGQEIDRETFWDLRESFFEDLQEIDVFYFVRIYEDPMQSFRIAFESYVAHITN